MKIEIMRRAIDHNQKYSLEHLCNMVNTESVSKLKS